MKGIPKGKQIPDLRRFLEILQGLKRENLKSGLIFLRKRIWKENLKPKEKIPLQNGLGTFDLLIRQFSDYGLVP